MSSIRLDAAVDRLLVEATEPIDRTELRALQAQIRPNADDTALDPPGLVDVLFDAIMPRISNPGVLRLDRRQKVLQRLEARAAAGSKDDLMHAGSLVTLRHELKNLSLLRQHRDRLIDG